jgi:UDP-N-acetylglucosamine acyltransferase
MISPSARIAANSEIEPGVIIGPGVSIGPFCVISAGVEIGAGTAIASHVVINGQTRIGRDNVIGPFSSIGEVNQDLKPTDDNVSLILGDRNQIGSRATLHRGSPQGTRRTALGDDNTLLDNVHIAHDCQVGSHTRIGNNSGLAGHVTLGDAAWIGALCGVHQFCVIGPHARLADGAFLVQDLPPFIDGGGSGHARPLGVHLLAPAFQNADAQQQRVILSLYDMLYRHSMALEDVREQVTRLSVEYPLLRLFIAFFSQSTRGVIR